MENNVVHRHIHIHGLGTLAECLMVAAVIFFIAQCTSKSNEAQEKTKQVLMQTQHP
jgi:hypothetical protein